MKTDKQIVLIADDDVDDRLLIEKAFRKGMPHAQFFYVENGMELMNYLQRKERYHDAVMYPFPNLIILDLNMPKKDGREALKEIKSSNVFAGIPVIIFTTSQAPDDLVFSYQSGSNSYIVKPSSFEELINIGIELEKYWFKTVLLPSYLIK